MSNRPNTKASYVALLRGINVGGKNILPMGDLIAMFADAGCNDVRNYIQSGNIVFKASASLASKLPEQIGAAIDRRFGFRPPLVLRTSDELNAVARGNPFLRRGKDEDHLHVMFLADRPDTKATGALDPGRSPPDAFEVVGNHVYLCLPKGTAQSKLTNAYFDSKLHTVSTLRNWATVLKLVEMTSA